MSPAAMYCWPMLAHHRDDLAVGDGLRLLERALDAVGHEGVDATLGTLRGRLMRDHEQRSAGRARRSPTTEGSRRRCSCRR